MNQLGLTFIGKSKSELMDFMNLVITLKKIFLEELLQKIQNNYFTRSLLTQHHPKSTYHQDFQKVSRSISNFKFWFYQM